MANVNKGPYFWDVRGSGSEKSNFAAANQDSIPQGSTYLETDGTHDLYIWNADTKTWESF